MSESTLIGIAAIIIFGVGSQWLAWRLRLPSILLLLIFGFIAGPVAGFLDPDVLLGDLLLPLVGVSVAIILFEGGLSLRLSEIKGFGRVVGYLVTVGILVTWAVGTVGAYYILGLDLSLSLLLGAVLSVTGPTVIIPLLQHVKPKGHLGSILKWEGIVIDPIGAMIAVLIFEAIMAGGLKGASSLAVIGVMKTLFIGGAFGAFGAFIMVFFLKRYWIPDQLQNPVTLMLVVLTYVASNHFQDESGLLSVTVMGIILANQHKVVLKHIIEFKENLRVLLISALFIVLAARLNLEDLAGIGPRAGAFLLLLIIVARPLSVIFSTFGAKLMRREKFFLMCMAPRGIVAAAIASVFALRLEQAGYVEATVMVPLTFMVIVGTVAIYGLSAGPVAKRLSLASPKPQGVLMVGAHRWARALGETLKGEGFEVVMVDNNWPNISQARMDGLNAHYGSILAENVHEKLDLHDVGKLLAVTFNDNVNSLSAIQFTDHFGRRNVYQLEPEDEKRVSQELRGRLLFDKSATYVNISKMFRKGGVIKTTKITEEFDYEAYIEKNKGSFPMFMIDEKHNLRVFALDNPPEPKPGSTVISLVKPQVTGEEVGVTTTVSEEVPEVINDAPDEGEGAQAQNDDDTIKA